ncbi:hexakisphosphate and diphosphoinositol-pentakisphosphate kinase [Seminavis robusta]|uniref:Inositol hexakisphosphate and diphosphoinositol-pentakisphosphate kinase n=1 Tax=Seminavis robusta TaxID=568900 RepID=A0A9N8DWK8_9STRA|nr:hexakisphosphate and diphosphoinositol-pentakisphosphate kinase [Seminavis robusta]|eukprot:Sro414_g138210.1 hexakisphosphate and diphosphoinositol-pentakisphosphate kinase (1318) ;mRNA; r:6896-12242
MVMESGAVVPASSEASSSASASTSEPPDKKPKMESNSSKNATEKTTTAVSSSNSKSASIVGESQASESTTNSNTTPTAAIVKTKQSKKKHKHTQSAAQIPFIPASRSSDDKKDDDRIRLGICAMDKKARSKPMAEILSRLDEEVFHVVFFGDDVILNKPIEEWPVCHVLIAFFSKGYPLEKAMQYVKLRKPFTINDLEMQQTLKDRRRVYDLLERSGIDVPRHVYLSRDDYVSTGSGDGNGNRDQEVVEHDDHIEVNGVTIHKPFVEKPVDADDHNIAIYYPTSAGGGCKKLFRKIGNRSSEFYPDINEVRRDGSYIYEAFVETQGTDVKMYTVGPEYGHAEARKSPTVDGKVERNSDGKEVRFPVILTLREKEIARRIVLVFKHFVKNSRKYYDDCSQIMMEHILATVKPGSSIVFSTLDPLITNVNRIEYTSADLSGNAAPLSKRDSKRDTFLSRATRMLQGEPADEEADSDENSTGEPTTKQKPKPINSPARSSGGDSAEALAAAAATLIDEGAPPVRDIPNHLLSEPASMCNSEVNSQAGDMEPMHRATRSGSISVVDSHDEELRCVIAVVRHGDRTPKQKLKVNMKEPSILKYFHDHTNDCRKELKVKAKAPMTEFLETIRKTMDDLADRPGDKDKVLQNQLRHIRVILERWRIAGMNRKLQLKPKKFKEYVDDDGNKKTRCTSVQLVFKYGGNLTRLGENQALRLGRRVRRDAYPDVSGGGILRLHSTFRHDLKIKTSDEGRVMKTAAAFAKGLLELEGDLPPILVSLVHKEKGSMHMLDPSGNKEVKMELDECKEKITANLQKDIDVDKATPEEREQLVGPQELTSLHRALKAIRNPRKTLMQIHRTMGELIDQLEEMLGMMGSGDEKRIEGGEGLKGDDENDVALSGVKLYKGETLLELTERWRFLYKNLYDSDTDMFDLSRVPDVHDNVRFDVLHNPHLGLSSTLEKLYNLAKPMADCVVPQEYGTTFQEKRSVGVKICKSLLEKITYDLTVARADNEVDMRYMINMDYSSDLPINTMGRRVRTRLYFTSESHLHTMLNVLRFAKDRSAVLSEQGINILNGTNELCYLTQIVMRLFEDNRWELSDHRRFRVEILFSPGATATPLHMHEQDRDSDPSRFDTAPLEMIGREGLTCQELENFFHDAVVEGGTESPETEDQVITVEPDVPSKPPALAEVESKAPDQAANPSNKTWRDLTPLRPPVDAVDVPKPKDEPVESVGAKAVTIKAELKELFIPPDQPKAEPPKTEPDGDDSAKDDPDDSKTISNIERKYFWSTVAVGSFMLAAGCLALAMSVGDSRRNRRYNTRRGY